jgi:hypothetical protein
VYREDSFHGLYFSAGINKDFFHVYSGGTPIQEVNARMAKLIFNTWMCVCVCDCVTIFRNRTRNNQTRASQNFVVGKESRRCGLDSFPHGDTQNGVTADRQQRKDHGKLFTWLSSWLVVLFLNCWVFCELMNWEVCDLATWHDGRRRRWMNGHEIDRDWHSSRDRASLTVTLFQRGKCVCWCST